MWIYFEVPPSFTNFCLEPGGHHVGEILGPGRFAVLAPTIGPSGRSYKVIQDGGFVQVSRAEDIGLFTTKKAKSKTTLKAVVPKFKSTAFGTIPLRELPTEAVQLILSGQPETDDRSHDLTKAVQELYGWGNWCATHGLALDQDPQALLADCAVAFGFDSDRLDRIVASVDTEACLPARVNTGGDDSAWKRVRKVAPQVWKEAAPPEIKSPPFAQDGRKRIKLQPGQIVRTAEEVLSYFSSQEDPRSRIYVMGTSQGRYLVRVLRAVATIDSRYLHVARENDVIEPLTAESLQLEINRRVELYSIRAGRDGGETETSRDCPTILAKLILVMGRWPKLPVLRGTAYLPLLSKEGEIISAPGYHAGTGYLLDFDPADYCIKSSPTKSDAIAALAILKDLLAEFCFKADVDRSTALALLLTAVSRRLYPLAPLFAVNAHQPGTGKGTLITLACILATGNKEAGVTPFTDDEIEMGKKVLATLLSGCPIVNIDNVDRRLGGGTLERVLTTEWYTDRILGLSKNVTCSTQVLWTANGNNLAFTTDMARRTLLIELDAGLENPETRVFSRDIEAYATENRGKLVSAALTMLQAFLLAGSPDLTDRDGSPINPPTLGSYGGWDSIVRRTLLWLGEPDPVQSQQTIKNFDDGRIQLISFLEAWYHRQLPPQTARDLIKCAGASGDSQDGDTPDDLHSALLDICLDRQGQLSTRLLGYYLKKHTGVVAAGYRIERLAKGMHGVQWQVKQISQRPKVSSSSSCNSDLESLEPSPARDYSAYDDAKVSSCSPHPPSHPSHDDGEVSSYPKEPFAGLDYGDSKVTLYDDDDDVYLQKKMAFNHEEVIEDHESF